MKKHWFDILKIVVSVGLLVYLFLTVDLGKFLETLRQARWEYLLLAEILMLLGTALRALRWQVLLEALQIRVPFRRLVALYFAGAFFNIILPTGLGGDAVKMMELGRTTGKVPEAIGTTLVDRAIGLWTLFVMALVALPFSVHLRPGNTGTYLLLLSLAAVIGGWVVMGTPLVPWLGTKVHLPGQASLERFYRSVSSLGYAALGKACLVSLVFNLMLVLFNYLIAVGLGVTQPIGVWLLFTPVISLSLALPISIGGLGVREGTVQRLLGIVGVPSGTGLAVSLMIYFLTNIVVGLIGGVWYGLEGTRDLARVRAEKTEESS